MFGRYRRLVPRRHRELIREHGLPKPNWFVGSAEQPFYYDDDLRAEIERVKREIVARRDGPRSPRP
jgi:hypothetical protein